VVRVLNEPSGVDHARTLGPAASAKGALECTAAARRGTGFAACWLDTDCSASGSGRSLDYGVTARPTHGLYSRRARGRPRSAPGQTDPPVAETTIGIETMKHLLRRMSPDTETLKEHKHFRVFGRLLHDPNLWHLNRRSAAGAFAVGLFMMYMPPFGQALLAAATAMLFRVNLPLSVVLVFISNPVTIPPMFYGAYRLGAWILGQPVAPFDLEFWALPANWLTILSPLALGCLLCGMACSVIGYFAVRLAWRWHVVRHLQRRRARRQAATDPSVPAATKAPSSNRQT
jgi:uncharacterized protein (DUF2062 family)